MPTITAEHPRAQELGFTIMHDTLHEIQYDGSLTLFEIREKVSEAYEKVCNLLEGEVIVDGYYREYVEMHGFRYGLGERLSEAEITSIEWPEDWPNEDDELDGLAEKLDEEIINAIIQSQIDDAAHYLDHYDED
jgi:hypothetical protein